MPNLRKCGAGHECGMSKSNFLRSKIIRIALALAFLKNNSSLTLFHLSNKKVRELPPQIRQG